MFNRVSLIAAVDSKWGIGKSGRLPWRIKKDMDYFTNVTKTAKPNKINAVIMGKNTWNSIPPKFRGLDDRYNVVISKSLTQETLDINNKTGSNCYVADSFDASINLCKTLKNIGDIYVIGGASVYKEALHKGILDEIHITHIKKSYDCDTFFPFEEYSRLKNKDALCYREIDHDKLTNCDVELEFKKELYENTGEIKYLNLLSDILENGELRETRNAKTYSLFGPQIEFDLSDGFPLLTTKKVFFKGIIEELLFFLRGDTDTNILSNKGVRIWEPNTTKEFLDGRGLKYDVGDIGPMYGFQWRHFGTEYHGMSHNYDGIGYDQLKNVIDLLQNDPTSRRILMTTFDPSKVSQSVLAPCHGICIQFYVRGNKLDCKMMQRSMDTPVGCPYNIASYATLIHILCKICNFAPGKLIMTIGDAHIYECHREAVLEQLSRHPLKFPDLKILKEYDGKDPIKYIESLAYSDFKLIGYNSWTPIKMQMVA